MYIESAVNYFSNLRAILPSFVIWRFSSNTDAYSSGVAWLCCYASTLRQPLARVLAVNVSFLSVVHRYAEIRVEDVFDSLNSENFPKLAELFVLSLFTTTSTSAQTDKV